MKYWATLSKLLHLILPKLNLIDHYINITMKKKKSYHVQFNSNKTVNHTRELLLSSWCGEENWKSYIWWRFAKRLNLSWKKKFSPNVKQTKLCVLVGVGIKIISNVDFEVSFLEMRFILSIMTALIFWRIKSMQLWPICNNILPICSNFYSKNLLIENIRFSQNKM